MLRQKAKISIGELEEALIKETTLQLGCDVGGIREKIEVRPVRVIPTEMPVSAFRSMKLWRHSAGRARPFVSNTTLNSLKSSSGPAISFAFIQLRRS